jgi:hypothetical protein
MVPLNLGTETLLSLKPHFLHGVAALSFWVPQLGQNTNAPPLGIVAPIVDTYQNNSWSAVLRGFGAARRRPAFTCAASAPGARGAGWASVCDLERALTLRFVDHYGALARRPAASRSRREVRVFRAVWLRRHAPSPDSGYI